MFCEDPNAKSLSCVFLAPGPLRAFVVAKDSRMAEGARSMYSSVVCEPWYFMLVACSRVASSKPRAPITVEARLLPIP